MSRIRVNIERLVLNGFASSDAKSLSQTLQTQLRQVLLEHATREQWTHSYRTPVLKLSRMPLEAGVGGAGKLGRQLARAIGRGLKP